MAVGFATLAGGDTVSFDLDPNQIAAVQAAISALNTGFSADQVLSDPFQSFASDTVENVYNAPGGTTFPNFTHHGTIATILDSVGGAVDTSIYGGLFTNALIVGNEGNDTITLDQGGTVFAGSGNDIITANGQFDPLVVNVGNGNDSISTHFSATITAGTGNDTISLGTGTNPLGSYQVNVNGNDTIHVGLGSATVTNTGASTLLENTTGGALGGADVTFNGAGSDTIYLGFNSFNHITETGAATVFGGTGAGGSTITGGSGSFFYQGNGQTDSVLGGSGNNTFVGGSGNTTMVGAQGAAFNNFFGGSGNDTMFADTQQVGGFDHNEFFFNATIGGSHTIMNYSDQEGGDSHFLLDFAGYGLTDAQVVSAATTDGSNLTIHLDSTTVTLVGVTSIATTNVHSH